MRTKCYETNEICEICKKEYANEIFDKKFNSWLKISML